MNPKTPKALVQFSVILVVLGIVIMDPLASVLLFVLAGILTSIAAVFARGRLRIVSFILLLIIISLTAWKYPDAKVHYKGYRERVEKLRAKSGQQHEKQMKQDLRLSKTVIID